MPFLRKQESRCLGPPKSPSPALALGQAGLSTARGEAGCFIRLKCYENLKRLSRNASGIAKPRPWSDPLTVGQFLFIFAKPINLTVSTGTGPYQM